MLIMSILRKKINISSNDVNKMNSFREAVMNFIHILHRFLETETLEHR